MILVWNRKPHGEPPLDGENSPTVTFANRLRLINITHDRTGLTFLVMKQLEVANWKSVAKDGASLPDAQRRSGPSVQKLAVGETYDFEFTPTAGFYWIDLRRGTGEFLIQMRVELR